MQNAATRPDDLGTDLDDFFARLGQGVNSYLERLSRMDEVNRLSAMSETQLRQIGLRREDIVPHVFRDKFIV